VEKKFTDFDKKLRELMQKRNINQSDLSRYTGISQATISLYLSGKVKPQDIGILRQLSKFFHVSLYELTGLESLRGMEQKAEDVQSGKIKLTERAEQLGRLYNGLTDDTARELIQDMILRAAEREAKKKEGGDKEKSR
jgi:transcriptional regulator with XRE-family HTH domain